MTVSRGAGLSRAHRASCRLSHILSYRGWSFGSDASPSLRITRKHAQRSPRRFEVSPAPFLARFQMISLGPFVPRVDEDQRLGRNIGVFVRGDASRLPPHDLAQPELVKLRGKVRDD